MSKMIYKYKDYHFECEDAGVLLYQDAYDKFVESCRAVIQQDVESHKRARQEFLERSGSKSS